MAFAEQDKQAMDEAAADAQNDLINLPGEAIAAVARLVKKRRQKMEGYKLTNRDKLKEELVDDLWEFLKGKSGTFPTILDKMGKLTGMEYKEVKDESNC